MFVVFLRSIMLYIIIVFSVRLMGKRQIGELQPSEFVVTILITNIATLSIEDANIPLAIGIVPILTLGSFEVFMSAITLKSRTARTIVSGNPVIVIRDGEIDQKAMRKLRFSVDDLMEQLRSNSIFDLKDVAMAIVETTGSLSVYQKYPARNTTNRDLGLAESVNSDYPPMVIVSDGVICRRNLQDVGVDNEWVYRTLESQKTSLKNVFIMTCDKSLRYNIILKEKA